MGKQTTQASKRLLRSFPQNIQTIVAKIGLPKEPHSIVTFRIKVERTHRDFSCQADPARKIELEVNHISI